MPATANRTRRSTEQLISDLQAKIEKIKQRAEQKKARRSPSLRHMNAALRSIGKAMAATEDVATRKALEEARTTLTAALALNGMVVTTPAASSPEQGRGRRTTSSVEEVSARLLTYVRAHPGQRGEEIAAALGSDTATIRLPMKKLIAAKEVRTTGKNRGMRYFAQ